LIKHLILNSILGFLGCGFPHQAKFWVWVVPPNPHTIYRTYIFM